MKKFKKILIAILIIVIVIVAIVFFANRNKKKVTVNDYTMANANVQEEMTEIAGKEILNHDNSRENVAEASVSSLVKVINGDEANKVNAAITTIKQGGEDVTLTINSVGKDAFDKLGKDDIFILDGNEETPLGIVYLGKITSKYVDSNGDLIVNTTNPELYEVFDEMYIDTAEVLTEENIRNIETIEGVSYEFVDNIEDKFAETSNSNQDLELDDMTNLKFEQEENTLDLDKTATFDLEKSADIYFNVDASIEYNFNEHKFKPSVQTGLDIDTKLKESLNGDEKEGTMDSSISEELVPKKEEEKSIDEKIDGLDFFDNEEKIKLGIKGKFGIGDLAAKVHVDFSIFNGGFKELYATVTGGALVDINGTFQFCAEIEGAQTKMEVAGFEFTGLNQKLVPLAYFDFITKQVKLGDDVYQNNEKLSLTNLPLAIGAMLYMDAKGELKIYTSVSYQYTNKFTSNINLVKDGKIVDFDKMVTSNSISSTEFAWESGIKGSVTLDMIGVSVGVRLANINLLDVDLIKGVLKAEGSAIFIAKASHQQAQDGTDQPWEKTSDAKAEASLKGELQALVVKAKLKIKGGKNKAVLNVDLETDPLFSVDLFEIGTQSGTTYDKNKHKYGKVSASNEDYALYINEKGRLTRESLKLHDKKTYYVDNIEMICGIDETYIYVLQNNSSSGNLDLYRITIEDKKEKYNDTGDEIQKNSRDKVIAKDVKDVFLEDSNSFYYVEEGTDNTMRKLNRATLNSTAFCTIGNIEFLKLDKISDNEFYVAVKDPSQNWLTFFGESNAEYYRLDKNGNIISEAEQLHTEDTDYSYKVQVQYINHTILRDTAQDYNLVAENGSVVDLPTVQGWEPRDAGVFIVEDTAQADGKSSKTLYLYRRQSGEKVYVSELNNAEALWTVVSVGDDLVYYVDDDENGNKVLYKVVLGAANAKSSIKTFTQNEFNADLKKCTSEISNSVLYFYSIDNEDDLSMQYRYQF